MSLCIRMRTAPHILGLLKKNCCILNRNQYMTVFLAINISQDPLTEYMMQKSHYLRYLVLM